MVYGEWEIMEVNSMLYRKDIKLEAYDGPFIDSFSAEISEKGTTQC